MPDDLSYFLTVILPYVALGLITLIAGFLIAKLIKWLVTRALANIKLDPVMERTGLSGAFRSLGFKGVADFLSMIAFWLVFLYFIALTLMLFFLPFGEKATWNPVPSLLDFIPRIFGAIFITFVGVWLGVWVSEKIERGAEEAEVPFPPHLIVSVVKYIIIFMAIIIALSLLYIDTTMLTTAFLIAIAALFLGVGVSIAVGFRTVSTNVGSFIQTKRSLTVGDLVEIGEYRGKVIEVDRYTVTLQSPKGEEITIPNSYVVRSIIIKAPPPRVRKPEFPPP